MLTSGRSSIRSKCFATEGDATVLADLVRVCPALIVVADPDYTLGFRYDIIAGDGKTDCLMAEHLARIERPLSPHLQIYRLTFTFLMSGFHRVTGVVTYVGFSLVVWWLLAVAAGPNAYAWIQWFFGSWLGRLVLFGFSWGLIHHSLGGIRHLIGDTGRGLEPHEREWLARATLIGSISLTLLAWIIGGFGTPPFLGGLR